MSESRDALLARIADALAEIGVTFERWPTRGLAADADGDTILTAYAPEVERLKARGGYQSIDVVSVVPDHPDRAAMRTKFLSEHTHAEDEVRFFVRGQGLFTLHAADRVWKCKKAVLLPFIDLSTPEVETAETVAARVRRAYPYLPPERLAIAPDCGMKYLPRERALGKLEAYRLQTAPFVHIDADVFLCEASWTHDPSRPPNLHLSGTEAGQAAVEAIGEELADVLGDYFVTSFLAYKRNEIERFERFVTDWEFREYAYHL